MIKTKSLILISICYLTFSCTNQSKEDDLTLEIKSIVIDKLSALKSNEDGAVTSIATAIDSIISSNSTIEEKKDALCFQSMHVNGLIDGNASYKSCTIENVYQFTYELLLKLECFSEYSGYFQFYMVKPVLSINERKDDSIIYEINIASSNDFENEIFDDSSFVYKSDGKYLIKRAIDKTLNTNIKALIIFNNKIDTLDFGSVKIK